MATKQASWFEKLVPVFFVGLILLSFAVGALWQKVEFLSKNTLGTTTNAPTAANPTPVPLTQAQVKAAFEKGLIKFGKADSNLLLVEVADPSCPYCSIAAGHNPELNKQAGAQFTLVSDGGNYVAPVGELKKLVDQGKASFVYLYTNGHGNGELGTKALYCAFEKGKFWEAHDILMSGEGYDLLNEDIKNDKARAKDLADFLKAAVNPSEMQSCLESGKYDSRLAEDSQIARSLGVTGTPGFIVNTAVFPGAYSYADIKPTIEQSLK